MLNDTISVMSFSSTRTLHDAINKRCFWQLSANRMTNA